MSIFDPFAQQTKEIYFMLSLAVRQEAMSNLRILPHNFSVC